MNKSLIKKIVLKEILGTSLRKLYEADEPAADPAADPAAAPADPNAPPPPADGPPADLNVSSVPPVGPPPGGAPAPSMLPPAAPAVPGPSMLGAPPMLGAPAPMGAPAPAPGAAPVKKQNKPKPAKTPNPDKQQVASKLHSTLMNAISSASEDISESLKNKNLRFLYEADEEAEGSEEESGDESKKQPEKKSGPKIDMDKYAGGVANLIDNYTSLVDIKKSVIDQAEQDLETQFPNDSPALKKQLKDLLRTQYHLSLEKQNEPPEKYAVGAKSGAGGPA